MKIGGKIGALAVVALMLALPMAMNARAQSVEEVVTVPREQLMGVGGFIDNLIRGVRGLFTIDLITSGIIGAIVLPIVNILLNPLIQMLYALISSVLSLINGIALGGAISLTIVGLPLGILLIIINLLWFPFILISNILNAIVTGIMSGFMLRFVNVFPGFLIGVASEVLTLEPLGAGIVGAILTPVMCFLIAFFSQGLSWLAISLGILFIGPILGTIVGVIAFLLPFLMWIINGINFPIVGWITYPIRMWVLPALMQAFVGGVAGFVIKWILIRLAI